MLRSQVPPSLSRACCSTFMSSAVCSSLRQRAGHHGRREPCNASIKQISTAACQQLHSRRTRLAVHAGRKAGKVASGSPINRAPDVNRAIGELIKDAQSLPELCEEVANWRNTFDCANTAATFVKAANLARGRAPPEIKPTLDAVAGRWATVMCDSGPREASNVLWACGKLQYQHPEMWSNTVEAFLQPCVLDNSNSLDVANALYGIANIAAARGGAIPGLDRGATVEVVKQILAQGYVLATHPSLEGLTSQHISNVVWSCAKLQICPEDHELAAFMAGMTRSNILQQASCQHWANLMYAISEFQRQKKDWQSPIKPLIWRKLLSEQQLAFVADNANTQELANTVMALARMATGQHQVFTKDLAQHCVARLLQGRTAQQIGKWNAQDVGNTMWSLAVLDMHNQTQVLHEISAAAKSWLPRRLSIISLQQVAWACLELGHIDVLLIESVLTETLLGVRALQAGRRADVRQKYIQVASIVTNLVVSADLRHLAADARRLVTFAFAACGLKPLSIRRSDGARFWCFHNWLANNQLLDGVGLQDALTGDQLAFCEEAARMSD